MDADLDDELLSEFQELEEPVAAAPAPGQKKRKRNQGTKLNALPSTSEEEAANVVDECAALLLTLSKAKESVKAMREWVARNAVYMQHIRKCFVEHSLSVGLDSDARLGLLFCIHDIFMKEKTHATSWQEDLFSIIPRCLQAQPVKYKKSVFKIFSIWLERKIVGAELVAKWKAGYGKEPPEAKPPASKTAAAPAVASAGAAAAPAVAAAGAAAGAGAGAAAAAAAADLLDGAKLAALVAARDAAALRLDGCGFLRRLLDALKLPTSTALTAYHLWHRHLEVVGDRFPREQLGAMVVACVFLAGKVEDTTVRLDRVLEASGQVDLVDLPAEARRAHAAHLRELDRDLQRRAEQRRLQALTLGQGKVGTFADQQRALAPPAGERPPPRGVCGRQQALDAEQELLLSCAFDFHFDHPHLRVPAMLEELGTPVKEIKRVYQLFRADLYTNSPLCLAHGAHDLALAAVVLASKLYRFQLPPDWPVRTHAKLDTVMEMLGKMMDVAEATKQRNAQKGVRVNSGELKLPSGSEAFRIKSEPLVGSAKPVALPANPFAARASAAPVPAKLEPQMKEESPLQGGGSASSGLSPVAPPPVLLPVDPGQGAGVPQSLLAAPPVALAPTAAAAAAAPAAPLVPAPPLAPAVGALPLPPPLPEDHEGEEDDGDDDFVELRPEGEGVGPPAPSAEQVAAPIIPGKLHETATQGDGTPSSLGSLGSGALGAGAASPGGSKGGASSPSEAVAPTAGDSPASDLSDIDALLDADLEGEEEEPKPPKKKEKTAAQRERTSKMRDLNKLLNNKAMELLGIDEEKKKPATADKKGPKVSAQGAKQRGRSRSRERSRSRVRSRSRNRSRSKGRSRSKHRSRSRGKERSDRGHGKDREKEKEKRKEDRGRREDRGLHEQKEKGRDIWRDRSRGRDQKREKDRDRAQHERDHRRSRELADNKDGQREHNSREQSKNGPPRNERRGQQQEISQRRDDRRDTSRPNPGERRERATDRKGPAKEKESHQDRKGPAKEKESHQDRKGPAKEKESHQDRKGPAKEKESHHKRKNDSRIPEGTDSSARRETSRHSSAGEKGHTDKRPFAKEKSREQKRKEESLLSSGSGAEGTDSSARRGTSRHSSAGGKGHTDKGPFVKEKSREQKRKEESLLSSGSGTALRQGASHNSSSRNKASSQGGSVKEKQPGITKDLGAVSHSQKVEDVSLQKALEFIKEKKSGGSSRLAPASSMQERRSSKEAEDIMADFEKAVIKTMDEAQLKAPTGPLPKIDPLPNTQPVAAASGSIEVPTSRIKDKVKGGGITIKLHSSGPTSLADAVVVRVAETTDARAVDDRALQAEHRSSGTRPLEQSSSAIDAKQSFKVEHKPPAAQPQPVEQAVDEDFGQHKPPAAQPKPVEQGVDEDFGLDMVMNMDKESRKKKKKEKKEKKKEKKLMKKLRKEQGLRSREESYEEGLVLPDVARNPSKDFHDILGSPGGKGIPGISKRPGITESEPEEKRRRQPGSPSDSFASHGSGPSSKKRRLSGSRDGAAALSEDTGEPSRGRRRREGSPPGRSAKGGAAARGGRPPSPKPGVALLGISYASSGDEDDRWAPEASGGVSEGGVYVYREEEPPSPDDDRRRRRGHSGGGGGRQRRGGGGSSSGEGGRGGSPRRRRDGRH